MLREQYWIPYFITLFYFQTTNITQYDLRIATQLGASQYPNLTCVNPKYEVRGVIDGLL